MRALPNLFLLIPKEVAVTSP